MTFNAQTRRRWLQTAVPMRPRYNHNQLAVIKLALILAGLALLFALHGCGSVSLTSDPTPDASAEQSPQGEQRGEGGTQQGRDAGGGDVPRTMDTTPAHDGPDDAGTRVPPAPDGSTLPACYASGVRNDAPGIQETPDGCPGTTSCWIRCQSLWAYTPITNAPCSTSWTDHQAVTYSGVCVSDCSQCP